MSKLRLLVTIFFVINSSNSFSQQAEIDPSLISSLTPEQIEVISNQIDKSKTISLPEPTVSESTKKIVDKQDQIDSEFIFQNNLLDPDLKKFGYSYFSTIPTSVVAVGDLPLPNDYKISLKDQFTIILSGSKELIFDLNVRLDGSILFPELGSISVAGETFGEVKTKLKNLIEQSYIGVQIDISIKNLSAKKITIVGAVETPGTYLVNPFSTISSALAYSGGISEIGTLRNIRLIRNNGKIFTFDLYKLLIEGDRTNDITIEAGDVIIIDPAIQFINLTGEVKRPAIYEIKEGEDLNDLVKFGLGFTQIANETNISLQILDIDSALRKRIIADSLNLVLEDVISVNIEKYNSKILSSIRVEGAVKEPGFYPLSSDNSLGAIIEKLEFVDVYPWLALLEQFDDNNLVKTSYLFSLKDPETFKSIELLPNARLFFLDINERAFSADNQTTQLVKEFSLTINHKQNSFELPVFGRFSVKELIEYLGIDMSDVDIEATYISPLENKVIQENYKKMSFEAKKYNVISFRSPINDLIQVTIEGSVDYPGRYTLESESTLEDLYKQIGSFKREAFLNGIIFTRLSVRERQLESLEQSRAVLDEFILQSLQKGEEIGDVNVIRALSQKIEPENLGRIAGDFSPQSSSSARTILLDGDQVIVPKNPNTISVLGEVLNPISFEYSKGISLKTAISFSGNYKDFADKSKVYVIRANGLIERTSRNIFAKNIVLEAGDTIIVPRKSFQDPGLESLIPITSILSDLAFSAAALDNLSNN